MEKRLYPTANTLLSPSKPSSSENSAAITGECVSKVWREEEQRLERQRKSVHTFAWIKSTLVHSSVAINSIFMGLRGLILV